MSSKIKVDNIADQGNNNMLVKCGSTLTLGATGNTITLASGASQSGFGRSGSVDWQTSIKTAASFSAADGEGYFIDTSSNEVTANLPAGTAGSIVAFRDYANNFDGNKLIISPNGSQKINNSTTDLSVETEGEALTLVYADDTKGWLIVSDGNNDAGSQASFIVATGGTITTVCTNFKVHTFTGPGTFTVCSVGNAAGSNTVDYLVTAGGGGGGGGCSGSNWGGGGGGAGGYRFSNGTASGSYSAGPSPLGASALPVSAQGYPIVVGAGGAGRAASGPQTSADDGSTSSFSTITSTGGGGGGKRYSPAADAPGGAQAGNPGGSGGGGSGINGSPTGYPGGVTGGSGNTPPVSPPQGENGGTGYYSAGGGGGAGGTGGAGKSHPEVPSSLTGGAGGAALASSITSAAVSRGGGGGGGGAKQTPSTPAPDGTSGGGTAGTGGGNGGGANPQSNGSAGTVNTGGGGGGAGGGAIASGSAKDGGNGGSGVVIIRYKFQ